MVWASSFHPGPGLLDSAPRIWSKHSCRKKKEAWSLATHSEWTQVRNLITDGSGQKGQEMILTPEVDMAYLLLTMEPILLKWERYCMEMGRGFPNRIPAEHVYILMPNSMPAWEISMGHNSLYPSIPTDYSTIYGATKTSMTAVASNRKLYTNNNCRAHIAAKNTNGEGIGQKWLADTTIWLCEVLGLWALENWDCLQALNHCHVGSTYEIVKSTSMPTHSAYAFTFFGFFLKESMWVGPCFFSSLPFIL